MKDLINQAYENVERIDSFSSNELIEYRLNRQSINRERVDYINLLAKKPINLLDIGSGSSAFAYTLSDKGILNSANCVEASKTRFEFAELWKKDGNYNNVTNYNNTLDTFLELDIESLNYNYITILDNTLSYLGVFYKFNELKDLLVKLINMLQNDGKLLIEITNFNNIIQYFNLFNKPFQEFELRNLEYAFWEYSIEKNNFIKIISTYIDKKSCTIKFKEELNFIFNKENIYLLFENIMISDIYYKEFSNKIFVEITK